MIEKDYDKRGKSEGNELTLFDLLEQIRELKSRIFKLEEKVKQLESKTNSIDAYSTRWIR